MINKLYLKDELLLEIKFQEGNLYVSEKEKINNGELCFDTKNNTIETWMGNLHCNRIDCKKIICQSPHLSIEGVPYIEFITNVVELSDELCSDLRDIRKRGHGTDEVWNCEVKAAELTKILILDNDKVFTEKDLRNIVYKFLAEGCPNYPKDERGSWVKWCDNYIQSLQIKECEVVTAQRPFKENCSEGETNFNIEVPQTHQINGKQFLTIKQK